ncbi:MAG: hypothetical protein ACI4R9_02720 [Kiritimatiellia bacterium]
MEVSYMGVNNHKFLGLPAAKPRVWVDLSSTASKRAGLTMHSPGRKSLKLAMKIMGWFAWLPIEKILRGPMKRFDELDGHEMIEKAVDVLAAKDAKFAKGLEWVTLYMGNDSVKTKLTVLVKLCGGVGERRSGGKGELIVKLGRTNEAGAAIRNEVDVLKKLEDSPLRAQVPVVPGDVGSNGVWTWSVQTVLPQGKSPARMRREHYEFLAELKRHGISHGDFAPWNCAIAGGKLYVWDWEDAGLWEDGKDETWFKKQVKELLGIDA